MSTFFFFSLSNRSCFRFSFVCSSLAISLSFFQLPSSATPTGCVPQYVDGERHYAGGYKSYSSVWGATANIETQFPDMCPGNPNNSTDKLNQNAFWVGIDNQNGGWVQLGYRRLSNQTQYRFYQEARSNVTGQYFYTENGGFPANGSANTYKVDLLWGGSNATSSWKFYVNGVERRSIPYTDVQITPKTLQVQNEMNSSGNQFGGTVSNPLSWSGITAKTSTSGSYSSTTVPRVTPSAAAAASHLGTNMTDPDGAWENWDTRYP